MQQIALTCTPSVWAILPEQSARPLLRGVDRYWIKHAPPPAEWNLPLSWDNASSSGLVKPLPWALSCRAALCCSKHSTRPWVLILSLREVLDCIIAFPVVQCEVEVSPQLPFVLCREAGLSIYMFLPQAL